MKLAVAVWLFAILVVAALWTALVMLDHVRYVIESAMT